MKGICMERLVEVLKDEKWVNCKFEDLKKGDKFRLFDIEEDKLIPVKLENGKTEFNAISDPYVTNNDNVLMIEHDD